jgi:hypothetical protein
MRGFAWFLALVVLTVPPCFADETDRAKPDDPWVGKSRDEVIADWGKPAKTKRKGDAEILIYEIDVFVGEFYHSEDGNYSADISLSKKDETGKRKMEVETEGVSQAPQYKKMKFKFFLDATRHVTKTDFPEKAKNYTPPK